VGILVVLVAAYALSLLGVHLLEKSEGPLPPLDLSAAGPDETVVQVRLEELKPVTNRLTVNVLIYPGESLYDKRDARRRTCLPWTGRGYPDVLYVNASAYGAAVAAFVVDVAGCGIDLV
jgi:hypothetical protein